MTRPNNRTGTLSVPDLRLLLSARDAQILEVVRAHRLVTTRQLQRLLFADHATVDAGTRACNRVLARLRAHRFLERLDRPVGGIRGGSGSYIWQLDAAGDRVTRPDTGAARVRTVEPTPLFLAHTLAITETRVLLIEASRTGAFELVAVTTEPTNWRPFPGRHGTAELLKPDLHVVTAVGNYEDHWFVEIDQGTESTPTLIRKCLTYERYRATGIEQRHVGVAPIVVWILPDPRRRERLAAAIAAESRLDGRIFRIVAPDDLVALITKPSLRKEEP